MPQIEDPDLKLLLRQSPLHKFSEPENVAGLISYLITDEAQHINGESIRGLSINDAVSQLRGPVGSKVVITVVRDKKDPFEIEIIRDVIKIRSVRHNIIKNIGYVRLTTFSDTTTSGLEKSVEKIKRNLETNFKG